MHEETLSPHISSNCGELNRLLTPSCPNNASARQLLAFIDCGAANFVTSSSAFLLRHLAYLLVGNSFTGYTYDQISYRQLFRDRWIGGWNLDQHFNDAFTRSVICKGRTFVVLQDFSTRAANSTLFQFDMNEMIPLVRSCKAVPVLFIAWETQFIDYPTVSFAYELASTMHDAQIIPISRVWNKIRASSETMYQSFLQTDGKHPTVRGAKVNAASLLKAFCSTYYQGFNWAGFSNAEIVFVKRIINQNIVTIIVPPRGTCNGPCS